MDEWEAVDTLKAELPGFVPDDYGFTRENGPGLHLVMGDLLRLYETVDEEEVARSYWVAVERLIEDGSEQSRAQLLSRSSNRSSSIRRRSPDSMKQLGCRAH